MTDLTQRMSKLGHFSQDPEKFVDEFQSLTMSFDLTWMDLGTVLLACCTPEEKKSYLVGSSGLWRSI
jgi:hypothetical protein